MLISPSAPKDTFNVPKAPAKKDDLNMETFMRLLTVQLATQNPLEPMNDRDFFAQIAQLGQVQGVDKLTKQAQIEQAQSMMGKEVTAVRPNAILDLEATPVVTGIVRKFSIVNGEYKIGIEEPGGGIVEVKMEAIQAINKPQNPIDHAYLVGKSISASVNNQPFSGRVASVANVGGNIVAQVKNSFGSLVNVPIDNITSLGE